MRQSLLATALLCGVGLSAPAFAQAPAAGNPTTPTVDKPAAAAANTEPAAPAPAAATPPAAPAAPPAAAPEPPAPPPPPPAPEPPPAPPAPPPAAPDAAASTPAPAPARKPMMHHAMASGASNLTPGNTRSEIAPRLPAPKLGMSAGPADYLMAAQHALKAHRTGEAQEALEMAETRALDRAAPADQAGMPTSDPMVANIHAALDSLGNKDMNGANMAITKALGGATPTSGDDTKPAKPMMHHHHMAKPPASAT